jgi:hypothetical protein
MRGLVLYSYRILREKVQPSSTSYCGTSGSMKTEDSGHYEESSSSCSGSPSFLEKSLDKHGAGVGAGKKGQHKVSSAQLPSRKISSASCGTEGGDEEEAEHRQELLPPSRKLSMNDYMAFDPISRYLLGNPTL